LAAMFLSVRKCCPKCFFALTNVIINQILGQIIHICALIHLKSFIRREGHWKVVMLKGCNVENNNLTMT